MQIKLILISWDFLPYTAAKIRSPICWWLSIFPLFDIKIGSIFSIWICHCFLKPFMLAGTMVYNQIHQKIHVSFLCLINQTFHIFHRSKHRIDRIIIRDIVTVIHHWRMIHRRYPQNIDSKVF